MDKQYKDLVNYIGVSATVESTGLNKSIADCIIVAQAFQWLDRQKFIMGVKDY